MTVEERISEAEKALAPMFVEIDAVALFNQEKVLSAFREERIALRHFVPTTGYGYGDEGRESLGKVYARTFGAERAIVSPALLSGTHALTVALFGMLRPGDRVLCVSGTPYDTLRGVVAQGQQLLLQPGARVSQVAAQVGFDDTDYFTKRFRQYTGQTPREYRR